MYQKLILSTLNIIKRAGDAFIVSMISISASTALAADGWNQVIIRYLDENWHELSLSYAWDAGGNWKWLPEAAVWIYVVEPAEQMVLVEGGTMELSMGTQTVGTFYMGRNEVTWGEWQALVTWAVSAGYDWEVAFLMPAGCADDHPVYHVNWYDAVKWCNAKSEQDGLVPVYTVDSAVYRSGTFGWNESHLIMQSTSANGYRLPTEVEWEFAARGGVASQNYYYRGSDNLAEVAWFSSTSAGAACPLYGDQGTWPVGLKAANELGLYDVSGNVSEWCWDLYSGTAFRHIRGGGWGNGLAQCALSYRNAVDAAGRNNSIGFRLARNF